MQITSSRRLLAGFVIALSALAIGSPLAHATTAIYYAEGETVKRWVLGTSTSPTTIATTIGGSNFALTGLCVDAAMGKVFWAGQKAGNLLYVRVAEDDLTSQSGVEIWTDANLTARGLSCDTSTSTLVWSANGGTPGIYSGSYAGLPTFAGTLANIAGSTPAGAIGLTTTNGVVYYATDTLNDSIQSAPLAGGSATQIANAQTQAQGVALDLTGTSVTWGGWMSNTSIFSRLATGSGATTTITTDATELAGNATLSEGRTIWGQGPYNGTIPSCSPNHTPAGTGCDMHISGGTTIDLPGTTTDVSSIWIVDSPTETTAPSITGTATPGQTFTCNDASWAADLPGSRLSRRPTAARSYQWYFNGADVGTDAPTYTAPSGQYGVVGCELQVGNAAGDTTSSRATMAIPTDPGAPTSVIASGGNASAAVSWTAPAFDGYSTITNYTVTASPGGRTCQSSGNSCTVLNLEAGTAYTFSVTATNAHGTGPASAISGSVTTWAAPGAPTGATAARSGSGKLTVSWTAPSSNGGSAITGYTATASPSGKTCTSTGTSCSISGLTNGTNYTVAVKATNAVGTSAASGASTAAYPYASITVTWTLSGRALTAKFRPVTGAKSYSLSSTGATRKSGTCTSTGSGSKRRISCKLTLKKGTSTLTIKAKNTAKQVIAQATKAKTARRLSVIAHR
jgi:hypothetical protein